MFLSLPGVRPAGVRFLLCGSCKPMSAPGMYLIGKRICLLFSRLSYNDVVRGSCPLWCSRSRGTLDSTWLVLQTLQTSFAVDVWTSWFFPVDLRMEDVICVGVIPGCALAKNSPTLEFWCHWNWIDVVVPASFI